MGEILNEMSEKIMERLFGFRVFLSAMRAESFFNMVSAVKTRFVFSNFSVAHDIIMDFSKYNYLKKLNNQIDMFLRKILNLINIYL